MTNTIKMSNISTIHNTELNVVRHQNTIKHVITNTQTQVY